MEPLEAKLNYLTVEQDLNRRVNKTLERCTSCFYSLSNEPTLACSCISEHLIKTGLKLTEKRDEMRKLDKKLTGAIVDIEFSIDSIKMMKNSNLNFINTQDLIKNAIFSKQQIDHSALSRKKFQQQMEKDNSIDDFRRLADTKNRETKRSAFMQRFSTSFEASFEGLTSSASVDFKEALNSLKNISQLTSRTAVNQPSTSQVSVHSKVSEHSDAELKVDQSNSGHYSNDVHLNDNQPTSSRILNEIIDGESKDER